MPYKRSQRRERVGGRKYQQQIIKAVEPVKECSIHN